jgi:protein SCO1/2
MKTVTLYFLLIGFLMLPELVSSQHSMLMEGENSTLSAAENYHAESLYQMTVDWTNQDGETIQLADYEGEPLILVMFYGRCTGTCPVLIQRTWKLYNQLDKQVREKVEVLAVSFDTENDTPEALKAYAKQEQLDIPGWNFVTASRSDIRELAMLIGVQYRQRNDGHYEHSNLITVLDGTGKIAVRSEGVTGGLEVAGKEIEALVKPELQ